jgi:hypothetical protein
MSLLEQFEQTFAAGSTPRTGINIFLLERTARDSHHYQQFLII